MTSRDVAAVSNEVYAAAQRLNEVVRKHREDITYGDARTIWENCKEAEGWLLGVRNLLDLNVPDRER